MVLTDFLRPVLLTFCLYLCAKTLVYLVLVIARARERERVCVCMPIRKDKWGINVGIGALR